MEQNQLQAMDEWSKLKQRNFYEAARYSLGYRSLLIVQLVFDEETEWEIRNLKLANVFVFEDVTG